MPDFEILWGEWGHIELKSGVDRPYGTFCLYGGTLRAVVKEGLERAEQAPLSGMAFLDQIFLNNFYNKNASSRKSRERELETLLIWCDHFGLVF